MDHCHLRGVAVPKIGLGTSRLSARRVSGPSGRPSTARHGQYGNRAAMGTALDRSLVDRDEVFLVTKIQRRNCGYDEAPAAVDVRLTDREAAPIGRPEKHPFRLAHRPPTLVRSTPADTRGCQ